MLLRLRPPSEFALRTVATWCACTLWFAIRVVAAQEPEAPLFIEVTCSNQNPFVEEVLHLSFRVGIQAGAPGAEWVQPFTRPLEVPISIEAEWYEKPTGFAWLAEESTSDANLRLVLNGKPYAVRRAGVEARADRQYEVWEWQRRAVILEPGPLVWPPFEARAVLASFGPKDFLGQAQVLARREVAATSPPLEFMVRAWPVDQRPTAFENAVGQFEVEASIDRQELQTGEALRLVLHLRGEGNLERLRLPSLRDLAQFHLLGAHDELRSELRVATYDLTPKHDGVLSLGPIEVAYFDPRSPGTYRIAATPEWTIRVSANAANAGRTDAAAASQSSMAPWIWLLIILGSALSLGCAYWLWVRKRAQSEPSPLRWAETLTHRIEKDGADPGVALREVLASALRCSPSVLQTNDLDQRLQGAGASAELAAKLSLALRDSVAQRYGSNAAPASYKTWVPWLEEWERSALLSTFVAEANIKARSDRN